ncbi:NADP-dependent oxidoreductase [Flavisolibacter tropicus]|uniref:Oxidoreductase n=1 Tax=Flavisolibacter tropicus TaxID=1492898 RepID=A0A172TXC0_9BACT|nr:NADP-dependent oxidoreductase [Flavisolibacter tropicus]ANE51751.1 oxidoreductase [Flavisolibacter tropicus]
MKAIVLTEAGGIENLQLQEVQTPTPGANEVLVEVAAISINPVDIKTRKGGAFYERLKADGPPILGWDIAGHVVAVGSNVTQFSIGDEVFGMINFPGSGKAYAQYVTAPETHLAKKPAGVSHQQAAATTLAALTAWQALVQQAHLQRDQRVLVHAAAGGVGHFAIQIARHLGAYVIGTASGANADFIQSLGAHQHIDYTQQNFEDVVNNVDVVLDPIGGEVTRRSIAVVKPGGTIISIVGGVKEPLQPLIAERGILASNYLVHSSGEDMQQLAQLLEAGALKPYISHQYGFDQIAAAHEQIETSHTKGKLVVNIR